MRFTSAFASIAALVATATAAPAPAAAASQYGSWALDYYYTSAANGYKTEVFTATYSLDGSTAKQTWTDFQNEETTVSDPESFTASWDGTTITLQDTVEIRNTTITISGTAPLTRQCGLGGNGRSCEGSTIVEISSAVA